MADNLVNRIYGAVGREDGWQDILTELRELTGARSGCFVASDQGTPAGNVACFQAIDPDWITAYNDHFHRYDPSPAILSRYPGRVLEDHVVAAPHYLPSTDGHIFFHEVMRPQEFRHTLGLGLGSGPGWEAGLILQRSERQGPFAPEAVQALSGLAGPLRHALELHARIMHGGGHDVGWLRILENTPLGAAVLNHDGRPRLVNDRGQAILAENPALRLDRHGLRAADNRDNQNLQRLIGVALSDPTEETAERLVIRGPEGTGNLLIEITPLEAPDPADPLSACAPRGILWFQPTRSGSPRGASELCHDLDLPRAEGELLALLIQGHSLAEASQLRGTRYETARTQLKTLMTRLGVNRQTDLIRKVLNG